MKENSPPNPAELRRRAEAIAQQRAGPSPEPLDALSHEQIRQTLHELRVHQIELEMQNEELLRAQVALGVSRARYFNLYDLAPVSYLTLSEPGLILEANLTAATLLGVPRGALVKQPFTRFLPPEDVDRYYHCRKKLFATGESQACELRVQQPDGALAWIHLTAIAAQAEAGAPVARIALTDITRQMAATTAQHAAERKFRAMFEKGPVGMSFNQPVYDHAGKVVDFQILEANESYLKITGVNPCGKTFTQAFPGIENDPFDWIGACTRAGTTGVPVSFEQHFLLNDRWYDCHAYQYAEPDHFVMALLDITGRVRAEAFRTRLAAIVESSDDAIIGKDLSGLITSWNRGAEALFGYTAGEMVGTSIMRLIPAERQDEERQILERIRRGQSVEHFETKRQTQDGRQLDVSLTTSPVRDAAGQIVGVSKVARDITARKRAQEEIRRLNDELEQRVRDRTAQLENANRELESFSYSISHDLRAPLRAIDGFSRILLEDYSGKLDDEGKGHLQRVRAASQRMGQLIDALLQLARYARREPCRTPTDLSALARSAAAELQAQAPERRVEFVIAPNLQVSADPELMQVVLVNLLENAWKFTGKQAAARIELGRTSTAGSPAFFVRDNGAGFDAAYADKLFGAFQRLHSAAEFPGTGIGLATVRRILRRHHGEVWAEGQVNQGATFYFTLPDAVSHGSVNLATKEQTQ